jgi:hypothetical protein
MENWKNYEYKVLEQHTKKYGQMTIHWDFIPDDLLYLSGFINSMNNLRFTRKKKRDNKNDTINIYREYGLDGMAIQNKNEEIICHPIQAKYWFERKIVANDIGTFLSVFYNRIHKKNNESKAYLYSTQDLQIDLKEDIEYGENIFYNHFMLESEQNLESEQSLDLEKIVFINKNYEKIWGKSLESIYINPISFFDSVHPDDVKELVKVILKKYNEAD